MAGNLIPLEEAAKLLGKTVDELTDLRSRNEIFGYRDGSSWKFKMEEISRFAEENAIDLGTGVDDLSSDSNLVADDADDLQLLAEESAIDLGDEGTPGSSVGGDNVLSSSESHVLTGSDLELGSGEDDTGKMTDNDDDDELLLAEDDLFGDSEEIGLEEESSSGDLSLDSDSEMLSDFDDESSMMLEDDSSEIALDAAESGVNLQPTDSGLSLDEEPLELGGSDIDALELPEDSGINLVNPQDSGSVVGLSGLDLAGQSDIDLADDSDINVELVADSGSNIDMSDSGLGMADSGIQPDNDFILTPLEGEVEDESSGSQVIALEDSEIYADDSSDLVSDSMMQPAALEVAADQQVAPAFEDVGVGVDASLAPSPAAAPAPAMTVEQPIPGWMVAIQFICLSLLICAGIIGIDLVRNMFEFNAEGSVAARLTNMIIDFTGYFKS